MTHLDGADNDQAKGPGHGPRVTAREIADAAESLTDLWTMAAQQATPRLSLHQLKALRAVAQAPGLNLTALAERLDIGMPTASRLCDRLEAAGLLERGTHPFSRREVQLRLTLSGRQVLSDVAARRAQALATVLGAMEPADRVALRRGLRALHAAREGAPVRPADPARPTDPADPNRR
ncbi:MarR family winged helix-turn-helix transcriptional regulator [Streptomyces hilarionis]|uniref:MarR family winged helix-turn-helix transcriptional regulator n=1 Tax=Streptomyces hilarionis TaxID=2839954 RepID=UPI00211A646C|nr:MarR family transcriptional regulator [Streptomyces hilarionis]MCQ9130051.1 MarR family transcriptional regulator [Streptomyces hilarionis]